jgi:Zn-dependent peptidase ImmA (M78 family)
MTTKKTTTRRRRRSRRSRHPFALPVPGYGERKMTTADFEAACAREGITVRRKALHDGLLGYYLRTPAGPSITINSRLKGDEKLRTEFHELGHYFLHDGDRAILKMSGSKLEAYNDWAELEANAVAIVALAPDFNLSLFIEYVASNKVPRRRRKGGAR